MPITDRPAFDSPQQSTQVIGRVTRCAAFWPDRAAQAAVDFGQRGRTAAQWRRPRCRVLPRAAARVGVALFDVVTLARRRAGRIRFLRHNGAPPGMVIALGRKSGLPGADRALSRCLLPPAWHRFGSGGTVAFGLTRALRRTGKTKVR